MPFGQSKIFQDIVSGKCFSEIKTNNGGLLLWLLQLVDFYDVGLFKLARRLAAHWL